MEGVVMSLIITLLFLIVLWLEPRRFSGMILFVLALCAWLITITDILADTGAVFVKVVIVMGVVVLPLTIFAAGAYMLFFGKLSKEKNFVILKSIGYLLIVGAVSAAMWMLAWFGYTRYEYFCIELYKKTMTFGDYILNFILWWFGIAVITVAFTLLGFWLYSMLLRRTPKSKEYNYVVLYGDGRQKNDIDGSLADYLDRAISLKSRCCSEDSKYLLFGTKHAGENKSEAKMMANYLIENGVEKDSIMINEQVCGAKNVLISAKKILDSLKTPYQALMLTNDCLVFRLNLLIKKAKMDFTPVGFKFLGSRRTMEFLREYMILIMWYRWLLIGWMTAATVGIIVLLTM